MNRLEMDLAVRSPPHGEGFSQCLSVVAGRVQAVLIVVSMRDIAWTSGRIVPRQIVALAPSASGTGWWSAACSARPRRDRQPLVLAAPQAADSRESNLLDRDTGRFLHGDPPTALPAPRCRSGSRLRLYTAQSPGSVKSLQVNSIRGGARERFPDGTGQPDQVRHRRTSRRATPAPTPSSSQRRRPSNKPRPCIHRPRLLPWVHPIQAATVRWR